MAGLPDYGDWVACDSVVGGDDEDVVGDGLGDDDAVEVVSVDVRELEDAWGGAFVDGQRLDAMALPGRVRRWAGNRCGGVAG